MAKTVKCYICKSTISKDTAYKVNPEATRSKYCCSKLELEIFEKNKLARLDLVSKLQELVGNDIGHSIINKEIKALTEQFQISLILSYIEDNYIELDILLSKDFDNNIVKFKYLIAILKNNLASYKKQKLEELKEAKDKRECSLEIIEQVKYKQRKIRKTLEEYIMEY